LFTVADAVASRRTTGPEAFATTADEYAYEEKNAFGALLGKIPRFDIRLFGVRCAGYGKISIDAPRSGDLPSMPKRDTLVTCDRVAQPR
jgi:hypothetical protein